MSATVHTFDIWDTCLVRATGVPATIFSAAARELLPGATAAGTDALAQKRDEAEDDARKSAPHGECTLAEIEAALANGVGAETAAAFIAAELRIEHASARPVAAMRALVQQARASGATVAFASDMYLPEAFLRGLLEEHGFARPGDRVFVSGDRRANKHSGRLFDIMRTELAAAGCEWVHYGDNLRADIEAARRKGIKAVEIRLADWTSAEKRVIASGRPQAERIAGAMRAVRLGADPATSAGRASFLAGVAAPWLVALTTRILAMAREAGIRRLYFAARDGDIPLRIARILSPDGVELRYLPGSRKAWCFPAMFDLSAACTSWLRLAPMRPDTLLGSLGFPQEERDAIASRCGLDGEARKRRLSQDRLGPIWAHISANGLERTIVERAAEAREACVAFLRAEGLFDDVPWTIADVGWSLHGQAALKRILADARAPREPQGVYFMTRRDRRPEAETGAAHAWIREEESPDGALVAWMSPVIEECLLTSADPSVVGYGGANGAVVPVHAGSAPASETVRHAAELRAFAEAFAAEVARDVRDAGFAADLEACALDGLIRFLREPMEHELAALDGLQHATAPGAPATDTQPLVRPYSLGDALNLLLRRAGLLRAEPEREPYWHSGSMAVSAASARAAMRVALASNPFRRKAREPSA